MKNLLVVDTAGVTSDWIVLVLLTVGVIAGKVDWTVLVKVESIILVVWTMMVSVEVAVVEIVFVATVWVITKVEEE